MQKPGFYCPAFLLGGAVSKPRYCFQQFRNHCTNAAPRHFLQSLKFMYQKSRMCLLNN
jgi:hypothetical protein